ncbi:hypothetical protein Drose_30565 [Dactylosporangium roseum]|uniref:Uncharacterized protein n=1 Tax=Dactylosporangium roseum TaxID=47989 RepID=A0ABY5Z098_9ACTN|nr:hypothetical protein [Dactylosporangium roseum]UWZ35435.1 hypothetical protein Drose_30565 [Dactylosporangium roseum]
MVIDVAAAEACTVDDVWRVPAIGGGGAPSRAVRATLMSGQAALTAILERLDVPVVWRADGRLTFFPHDAADRDAVHAAMAAARAVQTHLAVVLRDLGVVVPDRTAISG